MAKLPTIVSNIPRDLRIYLDRVREALNASGDDEMLTVGALRDAGVIQYRNGRIEAEANSEKYPTPPAPLNLSASGALASVILSWDTPAYYGHAYSEVWAAQAPTGGGNPAIGSAVLIGITAGSVFTHVIGSGDTRWYWVRFANRNGVAGAYNAVEGVQGSTGQDPAYILDLLSGEVTESQLATALGARIDLIDASASQEGSVNSRITQAQNDLYNSIAVVQGQVNDLLNIPVWEAASTYAANDQVTYSGGLYIALQASTNVVPTDTVYWQKLGDYTTLGDAVAAQGIQLAELDGGLGSLVTQTNALATQLRGSYTGDDISLVSSGLVYQERQARTSADSAMASDITTLTAFLNTKSRVYYQSTEPTGATEAPLNVGDLWIDTDITYAKDYVEGDYVIRSNRMYRYDGAQWVEAMDYGFADSFSAINIERTARVAEDDAMAAEITTLTATVAGNTAAIQSESTTRADADTALSQQITTLTATVAGNTAAIQAESTARADADTALSQQITTLTATVAGNTAAIQAESTARADADTALAQQITTVAATAAGNTAAIQSESTTRADADTALSQQITTVAATAAGNTAAIQAESTARADADTALSQQITTVAATAAGNTAAIQAESTARADADGTLFAQYTVKLDANGYVSGFGLASTAADGTPTSEFLIRSDSFAIASPTGPGVAPAEPFIVRTTQTTINGVDVPVGVYLRDAFIQNGSISNAKIGDAAIDTAKIADAAITTAKIGALQVTTALVDTAAITNAKIADAAITTAKIADAQITNAKIANAAINAAQIGDAQITSAKIADAQITSAKIADAAITSAKIADAAITSAEIGDAAITSAKIANAAITSAKLAGTIQSTNYVAGSSGWSITTAGAAEFNSLIVREGNIAVDATVRHNSTTLSTALVSHTTNSTAEVIIFSVSITTRGGRVVVDTDFFYKYDVLNPTSSNYYLGGTLRIKRGGTVLRTIAMPDYDGSTSLQTNAGGSINVRASDIPPAGTYTYSVTYQKQYKSTTPQQYSPTLKISSRFLGVTEYVQAT